MWNYFIALTPKSWLTIICGYSEPFRSSFVSFRHQQEPSSCHVLEHINYRRFHPTVTTFVCQSMTYFNQGPRTQHDWCFVISGHSTIISSEMSCERSAAQQGISWFMPHEHAQRTMEDCFAYVHWKPNHRTEAWSEWLPAFFDLERRWEKF